MDLTAFLASYSTPIIIVLVILVVVAFTSLGLLMHRMKQDERMKSEFISIIAHKFRTPLSQVKWLVENAASSETNPYSKESLAEIAKVNEHLVGMTGTMIELADTDQSSRTAYTFERVDLCAFVKTIGESFRPRFHERNIIFFVTCAAEEIAAKIDKDRFEFVIQTLLDNACIYGTIGTEVKVEVSARKGAFGREAVVSILDNGIGIDPADMHKLFTKFYRADNAREIDTEGFGVGLYLARSIVRRHYGKIRARSPGLKRGSLFEVTLPAAR